MIEKFSNRKFCKSILDLAQAYGPLSFWTQNLAPDCNPDAAWRALVVIAVLKEKRLAELVMAQLDSSDSRVRAWACTALAALECAPSLGRIESLAQDGSYRVRQRAIEAAQALRGGPPAPPQNQPPQANAKKITAIVSEDLKGSRDFYAAFLSGMRYQVHLCSNETETVDLACKTHPDLILTDNQKYRDNLSGLNMTWDICRLQQLRDTVIFMVTADSLDPVFLWSGGDEFFTKPLDQPGLEKTLNAYFQDA